MCIRFELYTPIGEELLNTMSDTRIRMWLEEEEEDEEEEEEDEDEEEEKEE